MIDARISLDGNQFERKFWNVQFGASGNIAGAKMVEAGNRSFVHTQTLLCQVASHLACVFCSAPIA